MELVKHEINYDTIMGNILLVPLGDEHAGHKNFNKEKFEEYVGWIEKENNVWWWGMGDYADAIIGTGDDRRYDFDQLDPKMPTPDEQYLYIESQLKRIKDKCFGLHLGNHDYELQRRHAHRYVAFMCESLKVPFLGSNAFIRLHFKRVGKNGQVIDICTTHGSSNGRTPGGKINALMNFANGFDADIYAYAHTHDKYAHERSYYTLSTNMTMVERKQVFVLTGGFLEGYQQGTTSYIERKNLSPMRTGIVVITVNPENKQIRAQA